MISKYRFTSVLLYRSTEYILVPLVYHGMDNLFVFYIYSFDIYLVDVMGD